MVFRCDIVILLAFCCAFAWLYPGPRLSLVELLQTGESAAASKKQKARETRTTNIYFRILCKLFQWTDEIVTFRPSSLLSPVCQNSNTLSKRISHLVFYVVSRVVVGVQCTSDYSGCGLGALAAAPLAGAR